MSGSWSGLRWSVKVLCLIRKEYTPFSIMPYFLFFIIYSVDLPNFVYLSFSSQSVAIDSRCKKLYLFNDVVSCYNWIVHINHVVIVKVNRW